MADGSTNGWDVAYGMNLKEVNALFLQQYLQDGPTNPAMPLQVLLHLSGSEYWLLDVVLGPPKLAFQSGGDTATLEMELVRGWLTRVDLHRQAFEVRSAVHIRPNESRLAGPLNLEKVAGEKDQVGQVMVNLGKSAYAPEIAGVDPRSVLTEEIGKAVKTFFANNGTQYLLGTIAPNKDLPACLNPTSFHFWTQKNPSEKNDACVILLIRTNGPEGTTGPLPAYPIAKGHSAAMILAGRVVSGLLVEHLNRVFEPLGSKFSAQQSGAVWKVSSSGGELNLGQIGRKTPRDFQTVFSCDDRGNEQAFRLGFDGFTVEASQGALVSSWKRQGGQHWGRNEYIEDDITHDRREWLGIYESTVTAQYRQSGTPAVEPGTGEVTFSGSSDIAVKVDSGNKWLADLLFSFLKDMIGNELRSKLKLILDKIQLPHVKTFALTNLLFPSRHTVDLKQAELPGDLLLSGSMVHPVELVPAEASVVPGERVPFKVAGRPASDFLWEIDQGEGSIDEAGVYTAPESVEKAAVAVVTAVSKANAKETGSAMVLVYQPPASDGVAVLPATVMVTPGETVELSTVDPGGHPVAVAWELPAGGGEIEAAEEEGQYTYTAPDRIASPEILAKASIPGHPEKHGEARIRLVPLAKVTVSAAQSSVKPGGSVELTAATDPKLENPKIRWFVAPPGTGSVEAKEGDRSRATYQAPKTAPEKKEVQVYAYVIDGGAGMASARITFTG